MGEGVVRGEQCRPRNQQRQSLGGSQLPWSSEMGNLGGEKGSTRRQAEARLQWASVVSMESQGYLEGPSDRTRTCALCPPPSWLGRTWSFCLPVLTPAVAYLRAQANFNVHLNIPIPEMRKLRLRVG